MKYLKAKFHSSNCSFGNLISPCQTCHPSFYVFYPLIFVVIMFLFFLFQTFLLLHLTLLNVVVLIFQYWLSRCIDRVIYFDFYVFSVFFQLKQVDDYQLLKLHFYQILNHQNHLYVVVKHLTNNQLHVHCLLRLNIFYQPQC